MYFAGNFHMVINNNTQLLRIIMNNQAKISTFFTKVSPGKRQNTGALEKPPKKARIDNENIPPSPKTDYGNKEPAPLLKKYDTSPDRDFPSSPGGDMPKTECLSPEQKDRVNGNKAAALAKLREKQTNGLLTKVGDSWYKALQEEFTKPYFVELSKFVESERKKGTIYPPADQVFSWTRYCKVNDVKVVILGQDPYHGPRQAHGLCFSVQKGVPPPPSLVNMYKELVNDIKGFERPGHGTLTGWSEQGVLLLNACLTVRASQANSHKDKGWEKLTDAVISWLNKNCSGIVFMLWGAYAQKKGAFIDKKKHHILKSVHPSPLSAHRGFIGCKHFSECNNLLTKDGKTPIDWCHLPPQE
ncbi:uracil-DNA glycosylase [Mytilus galloprovincialis]|uniref:Uracil-DNA glycosylase n=2 Tax=Mytilus galloprovincialis TaxID=29158 RepID=A0A8B6EP18_MYTGA|nr:uracil-DNA glycosylase [Mytilus galloprovincialis]